MKQKVHTNTGWEEQTRPMRTKNLSYAENVLLHNEQPNLFRILLDTLKKMDGNHRFTV